jgi:hypothetical protein
LFFDWFGCFCALFIVYFFGWFGLLGDGDEESTIPSLKEWFGDSLCCCCGVGGNCYLQNRGETCDVTPGANANIVCEFDFFFLLLTKFVL